MMDIQGIDTISHILLMCSKVVKKGTKKITELMEIRKTSYIQKKTYI